MSVSTMNDNMSFVTNLANWFITCALNKQTFLALLNEVNSVNDLLTYNISWLNNGKLLQRYVKCLTFSK